MSGTARAAGLLLLGIGAMLAACGSAPPKHTVSRGRGVTPAVNAPPHAEGGNYTVVRGDTLYSIAFRNQLDYHDLANWNGIGRDYAIRIGQSLRLTPPGQAVLPPDRGDGLAAATAPPPTPVAPTPSRTVSPIVAAALPPPGPAKASPSAPVQTSTTAAALPATQAAPVTSGRHADGSWQWPTRGRVVRRFGEDPSAKGLDITGDRGQIVVASRSGKVVYSGTALKGYGELIIVKHDEQYLSAYGYNRRRLVEEGDSVVAGQPIAELGDGPEQRPLLHFEIRDKGRPIDPTMLLPAPR